MPSHQSSPIGSVPAPHIAALIRWAPIAVLASLPFLTAMQACATIGSLAMVLEIACAAQRYASRRPH